jgi:glutathione synthase/RimK-type ligase-like ATP-grasp enzyme
MARLALATCTEIPDLDNEGQQLLTACREAGIDTEPAVWDDPGVDWDEFDLVLIRSTWDYQNRPQDFRAWTERIGRRLRNAPEIVAWNISKRYLHVLAGWGFPVVPSEFLEPGACRDGIEAALPSGGEYVVKPAVSAGSRDTARYVAGDSEDRERAIGHASDLLGDGRTVIVQPFLKSVETEAETAVILLGGEPVHAMRKGPLLEIGQGLEEELFREEEMSLRTADGEELRLAQAVVERLGAEVAPPLYARVDMLRDDAGRPTLLELEVIEPSLFLDHSPSSLARLVELLAAEVGG